MSLLWRVVNLVKDIGGNGRMSILHELENLTLELIHITQLSSRITRCSFFCWLDLKIDLNTSLISRT